MKRRRMTAAVAALTALLSLNAVLFLVQPGYALPNDFMARFFGPKMVRAEVILKEGDVLHDYRLDVGRITAVARGSLTLLERDGTVVTVPVAAGARIVVDGRPARPAALRRGMRATTVRDGEQPAERVVATSTLR